MIRGLEECLILKYIVLVSEKNDGYMREGKELQWESGKDS